MIPISFQCIKYTLLNHNLLMYCTYFYLSNISICHDIYEIVLKFWICIRFIFKRYLHPSLTFTLQNVYLQIFVEDMQECKFPSISCLCSYTKGHTCSFPPNSFRYVHIWICFTILTCVGVAVSHKGSAQS